MFIETLTSKFGVSYLGGREKFDEVALQVMGSFSMCTGFCIIIISMSVSGHISFMVLAGAEGGVVMIQTSGDIWVGKFISDAFCISNEHHEVMSAVLLAYRGVARDGGFDKGWKGAVMLQN